MQAAHNKASGTLFEIFFSGICSLKKTVLTNVVVIIIDNILRNVQFACGAPGSAVGWSTILKAGR